MHFISLARTVFRSQWQSRCVSAPSNSAECFLLDKRWFNTNFDRKNAPFRIAISNLAEIIYVKLLSEVKTVKNSKDLLHLMNDTFSSITLKLKDHSVNVVRLCTKQFECVLAHRIRRGQQVFSLYNKIWDEKALEDMVRRMRRKFFTRGKELVFTACGVVLFNWDKEKIPDEIIARFKCEIEFVHYLKKSTVVCANCGNRLIIDRPVANVVYCVCGNSTRPVVEDYVSDWVPFAERQDILIWRKEHASHQDLFLYKAYGKYEEISAVDFLQVQIDTNYRQKWDKTVADLHVVDSDPTSHSDIIYWEVKWPHMFANRDYVFNRRFEIDEKKKLMVIVNKNTKHPSVPPKPGAQRVTEYWSYMVIKPIKGFNEPGIEFVLTYCDDPGMSMPSYVAGWVAMSALPDFLITLREASQPGKLHSEHRKGEPGSAASLVEGTLQGESDNNKIATTIHEQSGKQSQMQKITQSSPSQNGISGSQPKV